MSEILPEKIHVKCTHSIETEKSILQRKYTLTHSDFTGDLFLTINCSYDNEEISNFYSKLMRDEVLAEWIKGEYEYELHVYLHVSGGYVIGGAWLRERIFRHHLPHVLKVIRYADKDLFDKYPKLDDAKIIVHFQSPKKKYNKLEDYGQLNDYKT
ncbi:MAG: hypothetical protein BAJALOKI3v1_390027 [Promethearchaeota archaeon]|nr:MAG: hypothetical protein BAJALOKI3v1_390027 [Candidatus Lokiarchaeota archaeon]